MKVLDKTVLTLVSSMKKILFVGIILITLVLIFIFWFPVKYMEYIEEVEEITGVEREVIFALIKTESGFRERALSKKGARGLMQVMPETAEWITKKEKLFERDFDLYNYRDNILIGTTYFAYLKNKYNGDLVNMLAAYNAGTGRVKTGKWRKFKETINYVNKVRVYRVVYKLRLAVYEKFR